MIRICKEIPDFELDCFHNGHVKKISLSGYKGKWLVLVFYPADFTLVCSTELEEIANSYEDFRRLGAEVLVVSTDSVFVHKTWHDSSLSINKIRFPMASDPSGRVCKEFGTYFEDEYMSLSGSFLIDPDGILRSFEINDNRMGRNTKEMLRKLHAARTIRGKKGLVCPASWEPGERTFLSEDALKSHI